MLAVEIALQVIQEHLRGGESRRHISVGTIYAPNTGLLDLVEQRLALGKQEDSGNTGIAIEGAN